MKVISVSITLCAILTLSRALPLNSTLQTSSCDHARQNCSHLPGAFCPKCDSNGNYLPEQCSGSTGYCWCVDVFSGTTLPNTTTPPGNHTINCGLCKNEQQNCSHLPGAFCPKCDSNGNYLPEQCSGSTGYCWCVDVFSGTTLPNTTTPPGNHTINCGVVGNIPPHLPEAQPGCVNCGHSSNSSKEQKQSEESDSECDDCSHSSDNSEEENKSEDSDSECDDCSHSSDSSEEDNKAEESDSECDGCSSESDACPSGWSRFKDQCYIFINTPKTWVEAEVYCQFDEANLASVHCNEGNRFVMSLTRGDTHDFPQAWLGGFDAIRSGYWMWSDGSEFDYNNWSENLEDDDAEDKNHDDNGKKKKNCLQINYEYDLKWFYASCSEPLPFVCAKSISTPPDHPEHEK